MKMEDGGNTGKEGDMEDYIWDKQDKEGKERGKFIMSTE